MGGVLTQDEYETKMKVHRQSTAPLAVATRPYGDGVVAKYDWLPAAGPFAHEVIHLILRDTMLISSVLPAEC